MNICRLYNCLMAVIIVLSLSTFSCGIRYTAKGRVIDAVTERPIEGAAVNIEWYKYDFIAGLTGLTSPYESVAEYEAVTDSEGYFKITRRLKRWSEICVAKKGYIFWSSKEVFNPKEIVPPYFHNRDENIPFKSGMIIKMEPFKPEYSRFEHGKFIGSATSVCPCKSACGEETYPDRRFYIDEVKRRREGKNVKK